MVRKLIVIGTSPSICRSKWKSVNMKHFAITGAGHYPLRRPAPLSNLMPDKTTLEQICRDRIGYDDRELVLLPIFSIKNKRKYVKVIKIFKIFLHFEYLMLFIYFNIVNM